MGATFTVRTLMRFSVLASLQLPSLRVFATSVVIATVCKGNEGFRGARIRTWKQCRFACDAHERQDEISKGTSQSALDSRLTDRSFARYLSCAYYIGDPVYVDGGRTSAHARLGRKGLSAIAIRGRRDAHRGWGGRYSGFQVTGMIEGFLGV